MLKIWTRTALAVVAVFALGVPAIADAPEIRGTEKAAAEIAAASSRLSQVLTELGPQLPDRAQQAVGEALAASSAGFDAALDALARSTDPRNDGRPATDTSGAIGSQETGSDGAGDDRGDNASGNGNTDAAGAEDGQPDQVGLEKARATVAQAFEKSVETLEGLASKVPEQAAVEAINSALGRVQSHRLAALGNLDHLIAGEPPSRPSVELPERPARPDRPDRPELPERPEIPERPVIPERPEVPEVPDRPGRP